MDVLKRVKASTLMETMIATVLIVVVFMLCSLVMNSLFATRIKEKHVRLDNYIHKLEYWYVHGKLSRPYHEIWEGWEITIMGPDMNGRIRTEAHREQDSETKTVVYDFYDKKAQE